VPTLTVGYAFGYPVACLAGAKVAAYVHYPTISTDMIARVKSRANMYNNAGAVARSGALSRLKVLYYRVFALAYGVCGRCASCVVGLYMLNSVDP
jgi:alpha-1,2-mannosyltransferase